MVLNALLLHLLLSTNHPALYHLLMPCLVLLTLRGQFFFKRIDLLVQLCFSLISSEFKFLPHYLSDFACFFVLALLDFLLEVIYLLDETVSLLPYSLFMSLLNLNFLCLQSCLKMQYFILRLFPCVILNLHLSHFFIKDFGVFEFNLSGHTFLGGRKLLPRLLDPVVCNGLFVLNLLRESLNLEIFSSEFTCIESFETLHLFSV